MAFKCQTLHIHHFMEAQTFNCLKKTKTWRRTCLAFILDLKIKTNVHRVFLIAVLRLLIKSHNLHQETGGGFQGWQRISKSQLFRQNGWNILEMLSKKKRKKKNRNLNIYHSMTAEQTPSAEGDHEIWSNAPVQWRDGARGEIAFLTTFRLNNVIIQLQACENADKMSPSKIKKERTTGKNKVFSLRKCTNTEGINNSDSLDRQWGNNSRLVRIQREQEGGRASANKPRLALCSARSEDVNMQFEYACGRGFIQGAE